MTSLPVLHVTGDHFNVGLQVGSTFRRYIEEYVEELPVLNNHLLPRLSTSEGREAFSETEKFLRKVLPQYMDELKGMAEGSLVPFEKLLLLNIADVMIPGGCKGLNWASIDGCTTVIVTKEGGGFLAHNEDGVPQAKDRCFMLHVTIPKTVQYPEEEFTAFCYPGSLPGRCFGMTNEGMAWGLNSLSPSNLGSGGITHPFLSRLLAGQGLEAALQVAGHASNGCSLNIYHIGSNTATNVEVAKNRFNIMKILPGNVYVHCNMYLRQGVDESQDIHVKSSMARHHVIKELIKEKGHVGREKVLSLLGDTSHPSFPVYRGGGSPMDVLVTVATTFIDLGAGKMDVYVGNPAQIKPVYSQYVPSKK